MKLSQIGVIIGAILIVLLLIIAVLAGIISKNDPIQQSIQNTLEGPSAQHPFGTDRLGRDIFSRVLYGLRANLGVGALAVLIALVIGAILGGAGGLLELFAGTPGKAINNIITIFARFLSSGPSFLLLLAIAGSHISATVPITIGIALILIPGFIRIASGAVLCGKEMRATGIIGMVLAKISLSMALAVLAYSILGFFGLGMQPPMPELGAMVSEGRSYLRASPTSIIYPGLLLVVTVLSFNILGESLNSSLIGKADRKRA